MNRLLNLGKLMDKGRAIAIGGHRGKPQAALATACSQHVNIINTGIMPQYFYYHGLLLS